MKTASSDEELAFKQKERDVALYTRKAVVSTASSCTMQAATFHAFQAVSLQNT